MIPVNITKEELAPVLQSIRKGCTNDSDYKKGLDIQTIKNAYLNTIKVAGEKHNKIDLTRSLVVKYYDNHGELHSVNLLIPVVYKYIPHIALIQPANGVKKS